MNKLQHSAKILADSLSPDDVRLTTMEVVIPRIVLAEFNTHRVFSRNSASSRAIPVERMLQRVQENPYVPEEFGANKKGMQAGDALPKDVAAMARLDWLIARDNAVDRAKKLLERGVHKQLTNRLLEPWLWHTIICTATEWDNFFHLRCHPHAHPDIRKTAELMRSAMEENEPKQLDYGEWHLPLLQDDECVVYDVKADIKEESRAGRGETDREKAFNYTAMDVKAENIEATVSRTSADDNRVMGIETAIKVCVGRCARVSYLTHDGQRIIEKDIELHDQLVQNGHMSPAEHVARPASPDDARKWIDDIVETHYTPCPCDLFWGNLKGWVSYRKTIPNEADRLAP